MSASLRRLSILALLATGLDPPDTAFPPIQDTAAFATCP